jgi:AcrR family transcriptional regulator
VKVKKKNRSELRTDATRQALLSAARELFSEKGMDLTTIDDITQRADVAKGTFYYHFKNKSRIVKELMRNMLSELQEAVGDRCQDASELEQLLDNLIRAHIDFFSNRWEDFVLFFQGRADLTLKEGYEGIDTPFMDYLDYIANLFDSIVSYHLGRNSLIRISCAVAGFVSGYYSFAVIATDDDDHLNETLQPVRNALVAGLSKFIREAIPGDEPAVRW